MVWVSWSPLNAVESSVLMNRAQSSPSDYVPDCLHSWDGWSRPIREVKRTDSAPNRQRKEVANSTLTSAAALMVKSRSANACARLGKSAS